MWLFTDKLLRMGVGLFVGIWVARLLLPTSFGLLNLGYVYYALFAAIASLGLDAVVVRELVNNKHDKAKILGTSIVIKLVAALVVLCLGLSILTFFYSQLEWKIIAICSAALVVQALDAIDFDFQANVNAKPMVIARNLGFVVANCFKIYGLIKGFGVLFFAAVFGTELVLSTIFIVFAFYNKGYKLTALKLDKAYFKLLIKSGLPLMLSSIVVVLYMKIDQVMIGAMLNNYELGIYSAVVRLSELFYFLPVIICQSYFPAIVERKGAQQQLLMTKLYSTMWVMSLSICLVFALFSKFWLHLLYGPAYSTGASVLAIHTWAAVFVFLGVASSQILVAHNLLKISFYRTAIGAGVNIVLNFLLIPLYGIKGAALATLISYAIATFGIAFFKDSRAEVSQILKAVKWVNLVKIKDLRLK